MLGTREYTLCSPFRANAHNYSYSVILEQTTRTDFAPFIYIKWSTPEVKSTIRQKKKCVSDHLSQQNRVGKSGFYFFSIFFSLSIE